MPTNLEIYLYVIGAGMSYCMLKLGPRGKDDSAAAQVAAFLVVFGWPIAWPILTAHQLFTHQE